MDNTLDKFAHFYKVILSKQNQNLNKHVQKLSHAHYVFQWLRVFALLIYKKDA
jgi:ssDNA-specific exonuclease RecJ